MSAETHAETEAGDWLRRHRLTVDDYYRMAEVGVLAPDARVELIEGEIIDMAPIGSPHAAIVSFLMHRLATAVGDAATLWVQSPARLSSISEPQPDLLLLQPRKDHYRNSHPTAAHTLLLIEVSDTTLRYDQRVKVPLYARYGVPEVWVMDVSGEKVHMYRSPVSGQYRDVRTFSSPGAVTVSALPHIAIDLAELFGR